jgi:plastocyanin
MTIPLGIGSLFGMYAQREEAMHVGHEQPTGPVAAHARIARYAFAPQIIEISAGQIVEWTNDDAMLHTVNAEDHAWHSGAIQPGASWRAQFDHPGRYPYFCGPHPFMKGMVIVR